MQIGTTVRSEMRVAKVLEKASKANYENLRHAAFSLSKLAKASIVKSADPSDPGSPPTTRGKGGKNIRGAIFTDAQPDSAIIGPRASFVGDVMHAHEFGAKRGDQDFPERPTMRPALELTIPRMAAGWAGTIGE
jgi:hypothetical protein